MSADGSGIRWAHLLAGAGLGAAADQGQPGDDEGLAVVEVDPPARRRGRRALRHGLRAAAAAGGAAGAGAPAARPAGGGAGWAAWRGRQAASAAGIRAAGPGRVAGGATTSAGSGCRRRTAPSAPGCGPTRPAGPGSSRIAVRLTMWRGPSSAPGVGDLDRGRTSTTTDCARWSCQPRRWRPRSSTAVQARVAMPMPKVGRPATPSTSERSRAGPTPIGVPLPWWTTRRPVIALPGELPVTPSTTAKTQPEQHHRAADRGDHGPHVVGDEQRGDHADGRQQVPRRGAGRWRTR